MTSKLGTVRVSGIPQDISESRLIDKLKIHFLRKRNGGGEILSVTISKTVPGCSFILFEDSKVARRVVEHQSHILSVNGKDYELNVSLHSKEIDPDELFVDTAVTVDYSKLPGGKASISNILKNISDVKCTFHVQDELCTFKGRYTDVQHLTVRLLRLLETQNSKEVHSLKSEANQDVQSYISTPGQTERPQDSEKLGHTSRFDMDKNSSRASERNDAHQALYTKGRKEMEALYTDDKDEARALPHSYSNYTQNARKFEETTMEDFSMVLDTDIFQYLQKNCLAEYQIILNRHGVEVIDVTSKDITTLYLHLKTGANRPSVEGLRLAYGELGWLFQEKEAQLRKEQLAKEHLSKLGLQQAIKALSERFTNLLINQDKSNVYLVGSGRDVSEAKQFLMGSQELKKLHEDLFHPSEYASLPFISETKFKKGRGVGSKELKMAPTFGKSIGSRKPKDDDIQLSVNPFKDHQTSHFSSRKHTRIDDEKLHSGTMSGGLSGNVAMSGPHALQASKGEDYLFKRYEPSSTDSMSTKHTPNRAQKDETRPTKAAKYNESQSYTLDHMALSVDKMVATGSINQSASISTLRRSNSFSGIVKTKQVEKDCNSAIDLFGKIKDEKFDSHQETMDAFSADVVVPKDQWLYTKDFFHILVEDITSDLQMKAKETSEEVVLHLRGKDLAKVHMCQKLLKELFTTVAKDFTTRELLLTQESKNVTVEVLYTALRGKCEKVKIIPKPKTKSLLILGPKLDCMEAISLLQQMFCSGTESELTLEEGSVDLKPFAVSSSSPGIYPSMANQNTASSATQYQETSTSLSLSRRSEVTKAPVLKPQLVRVGPVDKKSLKKPTAPSQAEGSLRITKGEDDSAALLSEVSVQRMTGVKPEEIQVTNSRGVQSQNVLLEENVHLSCICGTAMASVSLMACGAAMCPSCEKQVHSNCILCTKSKKSMAPQWVTTKLCGASQCNEKEDAKPTDVKASPGVVGEATGESMSITAHGAAHSNGQVCPKSEVDIVGIHGTMTYSEMSISLSGHSKNTTLKITYNIPDGIQGEQHPNPGRPFQGGKFHAFLPMNESTRKLLPSLKRAFDQGQTFTVRVGDNLDQVTWGNIPHKTSIEGGISRNGYPDSKYLKSLAEALKSTGIEEG
ncbi:hypothetical protein UPYG_G00140880 [Umbra pygmaea]|uniref:RING-type E3 ubiquitin transferase n=1 Tax=Umbra pygmaea TaxID=75934 RepID=A0ABD0WVA7_UMBPY